MKRINKYLYLYVLQGYYVSGYGWEDLTQSESYKEIKSDYLSYRENEDYSHRIINRRELNPEYKGEM